MHFAISTTWGPTDPTRAALPFVFAASALQAGDTVTLMLFHDAVHMATKGTATSLGSIRAAAALRGGGFARERQSTRVQALCARTAHLRSQPGQQDRDGWHERLPCQRLPRQRESSLFLAQAAIRRVRSQQAPAWLSPAWRRPADATSVTRPAAPVW